MPKQADINEVINNLSSKISQLTVDNAVLQNIVSQYEKDEETQNAE